MQYLIHLTELLLMILYIPLFNKYFHDFILKVKYPESYLDLLPLFPLIFINLYYFVIVLGQRKYSIKKNVICIALYLFLYLFIYIIAIGGYLPTLDGMYLVFFFISLSIAFFQYKKRRLETNQITFKK